VPIYEFVCGRCGERFEELVAAGTENVPCARCGAEEAQRVLSAQAPTPRMVRTRRDARKQESRNADLKARSAKAFGDAVRAARPKSPGGGNG
jgi:putative FmdB family regulatory protein